MVGWCDGAMVLGKLPVPGRPTILDQSRASACACGSNQDAEPEKTQL